MRWFKNKKKSPRETVDLAPEFICSRCSAKFIVEPEGYCTSCGSGTIVEFTRQKKKSKVKE